jgi:hypothetical protein
MGLRTRAAVLTAAATALLVGAATASADPGGSKNSLTFPATCGSATVLLVVNNANGQGAGSQDNATAVFSPAQVVGSNAVFHPEAFNLLFSFTAAGGPTESFLNTATRKTPRTPVTCTVHFSQTDPEGNTFALDGTVGGWFS